MKTHESTRHCKACGKDTRHATYFYAKPGKLHTVCLECATRRKRQRHENPELKRSDYEYTKRYSKSPRAVAKAILTKTAKAVGKASRSRETASALARVNGLDILRREFGASDKDLLKLAISCKDPAKVSFANLYARLMSKAKRRTRCSWLGSYNYAIAGTDPAKARAATERATANADLAMKRKAAAVLDTLGKRGLADEFRDASKLDFTIRH